MNIKLYSVGLAVVLFVSACAGPQKRCAVPLSSECVLSQRIWQEAIDTVVLKNFGEEWGRYTAVIWEDDFDNAWVVKGHEVNITQRFLGKLNRAQLICVAAHELAHLKLGHYYSRMGIIIVDQPVKNDAGQTSLKSGHYGKNISMEIPRGFGEFQEEEADLLAVRYVEGAGLDKRYYMDLLHLLEHSESESAIVARIENVRKNYYLP